MKSLRISALGIVILFLFTSANSVFGGAFDNTVIGMRGVSMGNALTGIVDDASAIYYNPAGLAFNEKGVWLHP